MLLFINLICIIIKIQGIQIPNYDGITSSIFNTRPNDVWGIEYNVGLCNNIEFTKTLDIDIISTSYNAGILIAFGTQDTFFAIFMGINIYIYICSV